MNKQVTLLLKLVWLRLAPQSKGLSEIFMTMTKYFFWILSCSWLKSLRVLVPWTLKFWTRSTRWSLLLNTEGDRKCLLTVKADTHEGFCSRGTLREQTSSVCTNDFMGILHPREQNFHPAKCSTKFNRLNIWEQAPGANNAPSCVLTRAKWSWSMLREQNPSCVSALILTATFRSWTCRSFLGCNGRTD